MVSAEEVVCSSGGGHVHQQDAVLLQRLFMRQDLICQVLCVHAASVVWHDVG
jgi:hypothetical protein